ncbi:hypothetical protein VTJ83DRAFT_3716 [Remersonia thermophila]|uniref:Uncharacterized protein n=1 Tax=Remersonia thermophila TaxID=72144 RepID=A0ABR4DEY8_9PEZI
MFPLRLLSALASFLAVTALAAPLDNVTPVDAGPHLHFLDARQAPAAACPTTTAWEVCHYTTKYRSTTTVTNGIISIGRITSTKRVKSTRTIDSTSTIYAPTPTTLQQTTQITAFATQTVTVTWWYFTTTVRSPAYAPPESCRVTTITSKIPGTTSVTLTYDLLYSTSWFTSVKRDTTVTDMEYRMRTFTVTRAKSTAYLTTVTRPVTSTTVKIVIATHTSVIWEKGCKSWACGV